MLSEDKNFRHEDNIARAETLPSRYYVEEKFFKRDCVGIVNRGWNLVGSTNSLKNRGDYFTARVGLENFVILNSGEKITGFVNVCRHRAGPLAFGSGNLQKFQCKYHGWTYDMAGQLINTPEFQGVEDFQKENCRLPKISIGVLGSFIFASLDPKMTFEDFCGDLLKEDVFGSAPDKFLERDFSVNCNWKVYVDNYLEGYHLPTVHKGLFSELDYSKYQTKTFKWFSEQIAPTKRSASIYTSRDSGARYFWLFPNTMFNIYEGIVQTNMVLPISHDRCVVRFSWYGKSDKISAHNDTMVHFSDEIQEEDRLICEQVQQNLNSQTYISGRYSLKRENGVHHFHHLISGCYAQ